MMVGNPPLPTGFIPAENTFAAFCVAQDLWTGWRYLPYHAGGNHQVKFLWRQDACTRYPLHRPGALDHERTMDGSPLNCFPPLLAHPATLNETVSCWRDIVGYQQVLFQRGIDIAFLFARQTDR